LERKTRAEDILNIIKKSKKTPNPDLIFFFIGKKNANFVYKDMKRFFNSNGIATQFFVSFNPHKDVSGLSKYGNLLLQMVNKIGGNLWYVDRTIKNSLLLGADVYHAKGNKSVASVVGQFDTYFKRSFSTATIQGKEYQEVMKSVSSMVIEQVENYVKVNKQPPQQVIFYRDGVGEGQLQEVLNIEVKAIEEKLAQKYQGQKPGLIFIVVTKRVDDRFAVNNQGIKNPDAGLVVIKDVVKSDRANFFMIAQKVTQGTANPTHYDVLYNNTSLSLNEIVSLSYELAWGYSNWMGPVKVPAPVQYAHKLCSLIGITQDSNVNQLLKARRFYM
jgi:aubergine-like protein